MTKRSNKKDNIHISSNKRRKRAPDFAGSGTMAGFPQELIQDILVRLPVKSLLRFKSVSKPWYSLISQDGEFAKSHCKLSSALNNQIFFQNHENKAVFDFFDIETGASRAISFPDKKLATPCWVVGSANGLICVAPPSERYCYIWNPCSNSRKRISLPSCGRYLYGFGYDSCSDDYKIVASDPRYKIKIFSFRRNTWSVSQNSGISLYQELGSFRAKAVHSNGALHWYAGPMPKNIIAFDLATDKFFTLERPQAMNSFAYFYYWSWVPLFNYQGSLCICDGELIWVMKEYGIRESWTKFATFSVSCLEKPVGISRVGKVQFHNYDTQCRDDENSFRFACISIHRVFGFA